MKKAFIVSAITGLLVCSSWATTPNMGVWGKAYARYRFAVDAPRSDSQCMQLSEIELLGANRERISSGYTNDWDSVTKGFFGMIFPSGQTPDKAVDGDTGSKWLDFRAGLSQSDETRTAAWLEFRFDEPLKIYGYRWYTADDNNSRDPVSWTLSAFDDDDGTWHILDNVTSYNTTTTRKTLAYEYLLEYADWVNETAETSNYTGTWTRNVVYGSDGKAEILGCNAFVPYSASTGNVVTVEVKTVLKGVELDITGDQESDVQAAVCLSTNGAFQVWSKAGNGELGTYPPSEASAEGGSMRGGNGWVEVAADGVTPVSGAEYTLRFKVNYTSNRYSVDVKVADEWKSLKSPTPTQNSNSSFPLAYVTNRVAEVSFSGATTFTSLLGDCVLATGFAENDEIALAGATNVLTAAKALWLNSCTGGKSDVSGTARTLTDKDFNDAYLLNLDITSAEGFSYRFSISGITVKDDAVDVDVTLERTGAVMDGDKQEPINGTLKFYGAATLAAFKSGTTTPLVSKKLVDDDFSEGETTTATFDKDGNVFFDAKIEEK